MYDSKEVRIVMTKEIARKWIKKVAYSEYRLWVYGVSSIRRLPNLMKSLRDHKITMKDVENIDDLGIKDSSFDCIELWSSDLEALKKLQVWFENKGCETTGLW